MRKMPPVLETQPRVVGVANWLKPHTPNSKPRTKKITMRISRQQMIKQASHLMEQTECHYTGGRLARRKQEQLRVS